LLGSRRRFRVNMVLAMKIEDEWKIYTFSKVREQKKLIKEFSNKGWRLRGMKKLSKKLRETGTKTRLSGSIESIRNFSCFYRATANANARYCCRLSVCPSVCPSVKRVHHDKGNNLLPNFLHLVKGPFI